MIILMYIMIILSQLKNILLEIIDDKYDIAIAKKAHYDYLNDPETIFHEEFVKE